MLTRNHALTWVALGLFWVCAAPPRTALAAPITWIGGNADWLDSGDSSLWTPADEPDPDDTAIFNTANTVSLGSNNLVLALTLSGGIDLLTNNFDLTVDGLVQLAGTNTNLIVGGADSFLAADSITINNAADLELDGGAIQIIEETGSGLLDINVGGELVGHGFLTMSDGVGAGTTLIINDGAITARSNSLTLITPPPAGTLTIATTDADARTDLDGAGELGAVNVTRNQTLVLNTTLADAYGGTITMTHNTTLDMAHPWTLNGTLNADNGFVDNAVPIPDIAAGVSTITGARLTQTGGTINVVDTDGTLQFDAPFTMTGGTFNNQGHTLFNANATITNPAFFIMGFSGSDLTVGPNAQVSIAQISFNLDGNAPGTVITVKPGATLTLDLGDYDNDSATNAFGATITLDGGRIDVTTADAEFIMDGTLNMHSTASGMAAWSGEPLDIGNDSGTLDADLNVTGSSFADAQIAASVDFNSDADVNIAAGGTLSFLTASTVNFNTVNGANNAEFTGAGTLSFSGPVNVSEAVTLNMVGGTVDLDGTDGTGEFINIDAPLTINAANLTNFGRTNAGGGTNTLDINNSLGSGILTVNLDNPDAKWTLNAPGVMNLVNDNVEATLLAGNDINLNGTVNVTGDVRSDARLDIAGVVNINTANQPLRLSGGTLNNPNTILGGTITGNGLLGADSGSALQGFGTISTGIDFSGTSNLRATGGTLTILGPINAVNILGTADDSGTLHIVNPWVNGGGIVGVVLTGGVLQGGTITNNNGNGLQGHGTISSRVINNTQILAVNGGTLVVVTAANDNDWDGATGSGQLRALSANLELHDNGAPFGFTGTVFAQGIHEVFTNGFALDFNPGSTLALNNGGRYRSTSSTDLGGAVNIGAGAPATLQVTNNFFLTFEPTSTTTLNADLFLLNNNVIIDAGATFAGTGALILPDNSHLVAKPNANIDVLLINAGTLRPGGFDTVGRVDFRDYQQTGTGELFVELTGTALNQFDRLVVNGAALLNGTLNVDIDAGFVPALGSTFNILSATGGISGTFSEILTSGMPAGLTMKVSYSPTLVQLQVVSIVPLALDFDSNGYVNDVDLQFMKQCFTGPNVPGPAVGCAQPWHDAADTDNDNDVDLADYGRFQRCYTGSALITDPNCAN